MLTDPERGSERFVAVMVRTTKHFTDNTVVLKPGDHPFIRHSSSVHYSSAGFFSARAVSRALARGTCHLLDDMSPDLLRRVRDGLLESPHTVNAVKDYCRGEF